MAPSTVEVKTILMMRTDNLALKNNPKTHRLIFMRADLIDGKNTIAVAADQHSPPADTPPKRHLGGHVIDGADLLKPLSVIAITHCCSISRALLALASRTAAEPHIQYNFVTSMPR